MCSAEEKSEKRDSRLAEYRRTHDAAGLLATPGSRTYECRRCGAEIVEEDNVDDDESPCCYAMITSAGRDHDYTCPERMP